MISFTYTCLTLQERENEVRKLNEVGIYSFFYTTAHTKKELREVQQDKVSVEYTLSTACLLTTQYKTQMELMDLELINAKNQLQVLEAENIKLVSDNIQFVSELNVLKTIPTQPVPASESLPKSIQGQQVVSLLQSSLTTCSDQF